MNLELFSDSKSDYAFDICVRSITFDIEDLGSKMSSLSI